MTRPAIHPVALRAATVLAVIALFPVQLNAAEKGKSAQPNAAITWDSYRAFFINNLFNYYGNNGDGAYNRLSVTNEGLEYPKGSERTMLFEDGILWGGKHKGRAIAKVGGSQYRHAVQAGPLLSSGTAITDPVPADPTDPRYRMYATRPDVRPDIPFSAVEAMLTTEELPYIRRYESMTARDLYDRYIADWNGWPAADGAPFTDVDRNGVYDPAVDVPGQPGADQTLWHVANDMNDSLLLRLTGSPHIGLEVQRTIWGYKRTGALNTTIFIGTVIINKSGAPVDSMYIAQWADPDLGDGGDDLVGCDTTLALSYFYNGRTPDAKYGVAVPAGGYAFVQGPKTPGAPTDTATFLGSRTAGYKNLGITAFVYYSDGATQYAQPSQGAGGDLTWYRQMQGLGAQTGVLYLDPFANVLTPICVPGDPVKATDGSAGWVDGMGVTIVRDRSLCMSSGPFTLADGDTQHVIIACIVSQGADRLSSIAALRADARSVRRAFNTGTLARRMPPVSCSITPQDTLTALAFRVDARSAPVTSAAIAVSTYKNVPVATVPLADDGLHDDDVAADGVWGGTVLTPVRAAGLRAGVTLVEAGNDTVVWDRAIDEIITARLAIASYSVASDNINNDGIANPGENVRWTFALRNDSPLDLSGLVTRSSPIVGDGQYTIGTLGSHAAFQPAYDAVNPATWFVFDVPAAHADSSIRIAIVTTDDSMNIWRDTLTFPVRPLPGAVYTSPLQRIAGKATGSFTIRIADPTRVKDHLYVIRGVDSATAIGSYSIKDSTTGVVVLTAHAPPDALGHESPVVDGFKVLKGTIETNPGMRSWEIPQGTRRFSPVGGDAARGLEGFSAVGSPDVYDRTRGTVGAAVNFLYAGIGTALKPADCHTVLLKLAAVNNVTLWDPKAIPSDTNFSRAYRYLESSTTMAPVPSFVPWIINKAEGFPYQDYNYSVPFSAWDMDTDPPTRLAVGHMENNSSSGKVDGRYWPGPIIIENGAAREYAYIFKAPYTDTPEPALTVNLANNATTPLMWVMACSRRSDVPWVAGDQFKIIACASPTSQDAWVFNPSVVAGVQQTDMPTSFALLQNYPNPFNPSTTIRYDLPAQSEVTITVYDVLGRAVRHVIHEVQPAGSHAVLWHGDSDAGVRVASGVYFYRCTIERSDRGGQFDQTMKMILIK